MNKELEEVYTAAITSNKKSFQPWYDRGVFYLQEGSDEKAIQDFEKAIELNTSCFQAYNQLAHIYARKSVSERDNAKKKGYLNDAIANLNEAAKYSLDKQNEFYASTLFFRGEMYEKRGSLSLALDDYINSLNIYSAIGNSDAIKYTEAKVGHLERRTSVPIEKNEHLKRLMDKTLLKGIERDVLDEQSKAAEFLSSDAHEHSKTNGFWILRRWNSYTPILANRNHKSKGGGYFFQFNDVGIAIDPGFNFIENFSSEGFKFKDITHVFITHAHNDHTADLESILTLLHEYNEINMITKNNQNFTKKCIKIYMTASTFKKFSTILDLTSQCDYDIILIKVNEHIDLGKGAPENIHITTISAKHQDLSSDKSSIGFVFEDRKSKFSLVYTGDTGYNAEIDSCYRSLKKDLGSNKIKKVILLAHIGGFKKYESFDYGKGIKENEEFFYKNHLGRMGLAKIVESLKPQVCLISEFGEEFSTNKNRMKLAAIYSEVYSSTRFFAVDIGFCVNTNGEILAYQDESTLTQDFDPPDKVKVEETNGGSLFFYNKEVNPVTLVQTLLDSKERTDKN